MNRTLNTILVGKDRWIWTSVLFLTVSIVCIIVIVKLSTSNTTNNSNFSLNRNTNFTNYTNTVLNNTYGNNSNNNSNNNNNGIPSNDVHLVYFGNSMLLMNDCPDVIKSMIEQVSKNSIANNDNDNSLSSAGDSDNDSDNDAVVRVKSSNSNLLTPVTNVTSDTCLRKGATLTSLFEKHKCSIVRDYVTITHSTTTITMNTTTNNNNTRSNSTQQQQEVEVEQTLYTFKKDTNLYHNWDYIIMNDHSQNPARNTTRLMSIETIKNLYGPLLLLYNKNDNTNDLQQVKSKLPPIPILIQTPAYRIRGIMDTTDLGTFDNFTNLISYGIIQYKHAFDEILLSSTTSSSTEKDAGATVGVEARIAEVGIAYQYIRNTNTTLYKKLYQNDDFHPSKYGTWLQSCIIYITMFHSKPPDYDKDWLPSSYLSSTSSTIPTTRSTSSRSSNSKTKTKSGTSNDNNDNNNDKDSNGNKNNNKNGNSNNNKNGNNNNNNNDNNDNQNTDNNSNSNSNNNGNNNDNNDDDDQNNQLPTKAEAAKLLQIACDITRYC